jgi:hypothetical protein
LRRNARLRLKSVSDRDWVGELASYLQKSFAQICEQASQPRSMSELRINPPLAIAEAKFFLLGLEGGLFRLDDQGRLQSELLATSPGEDAPEVFSLRSLPPHLVRESICQLATFSSLILQRGWLPTQIEMEQSFASYGIDMTVKSSAGEIFVGVEIKRSEHELQKLASDFRQCCQRGRHAKADCAFQQNHGICEFCERYRPRYLWAVAPGRDVCFKLKYESETIALEELKTLPPRSHIEFAQGII